MGTAIPLADETWNPVTGCTKTSPGCANCYIERTPPFRMSGRKFVDGTTGVQLHPERLDKPLHWRKPRRIFVCSLADLFHEDVPDGFIESVLDVAMKAPQHVYQVLTKRPERMREIMLRYYNLDDRALELDIPRDTEPLPNLWLGVTIENARYTYRADILREIPAVVRFISAEPLLGSLFLYDDRDIGFMSDRALRRKAEGKARRGMYRPLDLTGIDWLIAGAESGPHARPMNEKWVRELRDACLAELPCHTCEAGDPCFACKPTRPAFFYKQQIVSGRKVECPELDVRQWIEFPA